MLPELLQTIHTSIRATVPLMEAVTERAQELAPVDPVAARIAEYLPKHIEEEQDHDDWLLEDLQVLGLEADAVLSRVPSAAVACLVGSQYYWSLHAHPVAMLGFLAVLEGNPPQLGHIESVQTRSGLPKAAFRTLVEHAVLDPDHADELFTLIDELPLTPWQASLLGLSALHTVEQVSLIFQGILEEHADRRAQAAS
jgi:hypothetical protein